LQPSRELELPRPSAVLPEVIKELSFFVEYLHHTPRAVHHVKMSLGIEADSLGTEHPAGAVAKLADRISKAPRSVQHLHSEVHGVNHHEFIAIEPQLGGIVELAVPRTVLAEAVQHATLH